MKTFLILCLLFPALCFSSYADSQCDEAIINQGLDLLKAESDAREALPEAKVFDEAQNAYVDAREALPEAKVFDYAFKAYDDARKAYHEATRALPEAKVFDEAEKSYYEAQKALADARKAFDDAQKAFDDATRALPEARVFDEAEKDWADAITAYDEAFKALPEYIAYDEALKVYNNVYKAEPAYKNMDNFRDSIEVQCWEKVRKAYNDRKVKLESTRSIDKDSMMRPLVPRHENRKNTGKGVQ